MAQQRVALLGIGTMGSGMAANLLKAGFPLTVYNRTRAKAEPLAAQGATIADTPADAAKGAGRGTRWAALDARRGILRISSRLRARIGAIASTPATSAGAI